jgi:lysophospholipase L1-like esterase
MLSRKPLLLVPLLLLACAGPARAQRFFFKDGDVVVMMGDSITEQRLYSNYVEAWTVTRFPAWKITFRNVGIGGDRSPGGNGRFKRDVLAFQPTALTVDFGMNDGNYKGFEEKAFDTYMKGLQGIADQAAAAKIRVAWITPQPLERKEPGPHLTGYNETLEKYSEGVEQTARKNGGLFVDQFHPYLAVINKVREADANLRVTGGDPVHPGPPGQALMAAAILKAMNFPREVSDVAIDAAGKGEPKTKNCKVSALEVKDGVRFKRLDQALPFFPEDAKGILKWTPLLEEMNHYGLQVQGLKPGKYEVRLGGKKVAEHTAEELAKGVNLAEAALTEGPVADQVKAVWKAVKAKTDYFHDQIFRGVMLAGGKSPALKDVAPDQVEAQRKKLFEERMQKMPELDAAIRAALEMRPYDVEVVPTGKE